MCTGVLPQLNDAELRALLSAPSKYLRHNYFCCDCDMSLSHVYYGI
jgi:hypothetical protein